MKDLIGILDSGVGGVSVLQKAVELLPNENFIYYGDNAHAPYGPRSHGEIRDLSKRAVDHVLAHDVKAIVLACNTMTAAYAAELRETAKIPVIGMEPAVKPASLARSGGLILAMATGASACKMHFGHRGSNHPVKELATGRTYITAQNHGYCVDEATLDPAVAKVTYRNVNDGTVEGLDYARDNCFSLQFMPEAYPGPHEAKHLMDRFINSMGGDR